MLIDGISNISFKIGTQTLDTAVLISFDMSGLILGIFYPCIFDNAGFSSLAFSVAPANVKSVVFVSSCYCHYRQKCRGSAVVFC